MCKDANGDWKSDEDCRSIGIDIACYDDQNESLKYPIKIASSNVPYGMYGAFRSDPDQGWHVDEYEY